MQYPVILPDLGAAPIELSLWFVDNGDLVRSGDRLVEVLVAGATFDVPSPATGTMCQRLAWPRDPIVPGQVLGLVEVEEGA
jgi:2-oxoglutarate dehydrogenase E2 component (dihydrolipoamide succinyltransferase)/2-oxoisovalerate dehydrogenase E2 component (dihydrolipoyl transacylase)